MLRIGLTDQELATVRRRERILHKVARKLAFPFRGIAHDLFADLTWGQIANNHGMGINQLQALFAKECRRVATSAELKELWAAFKATGIKEFKKGE